MRLPTSVGLNTAPRALWASIHGVALQIQRDERLAVQTCDQRGLAVEGDPLRDLYGESREDRGQARRQRSHGSHRHPAGGRLNKGIRCIVEADSVDEAGNAGADLRQEYGAKPRQPADWLDESEWHRLCTTSFIEFLNRPMPVVVGYDHDERCRPFIT